jgi:hypothetical protein
LNDTKIVNWEKLVQGYDCSVCNPKYSLGFYFERVFEASCYKPYFNTLSAIGYFTQKENINEIQLEKYYSFQMSAIVDGKVSLLPCELKYDENSNNYQLDCITNGKNSVLFYNTFFSDDKTKELIYIQGSHQYALKECFPTKIITFKQISTECSSSDSLFKIYFYADIEGFSNEEKIALYLEQPAYAYMICSIPKSDKSSEQFIYCTINVSIFPLISANEITLSSEFYIHQEWGINNWDKISKTISTNQCSSFYQYAFTTVKYFDTECYLNGYNSFVAEGTFENNNNENIKNFNVRKIKFETFVDSVYKAISCEIYPPDISNVYSRIYCYSNETKSIKIFPTI